MKKVVFDTPKSEIVPVSISKVNVHKFYGVQMTSLENGRGFITREQYSKGNYVVRTAEGVSIGKGWTHLAGKSSLHEFISELMNNRTVYEFDTFSELAAWLEEKV